MLNWDAWVSRHIPPTVAGPFSHEAAYFVGWGFGGMFVQLKRDGKDKTELWVPMCKECQERIRREVGEWER